MQFRSADTPAPAGLNDGGRGGTAGVGDAARIDRDLGLPRVVASGWGSLVCVCAT
jgi:hypothetical protein